MDIGASRVNTFESMNEILGCNDSNETPFSNTSTQYNLFSLKL